MYFKVRNPDNSRGKSASSQGSLLSGDKRGLGARDRGLPSDPEQRLSSSVVGASLFHTVRMSLA